MLDIGSIYLISPEIFKSHDELLAILTTKKSLNVASLESADLENDFNFGFTKNSNRENVCKNRKVLFAQLGIKENQLAIPKQIHSSNVCVVDKPGIYEDCDALVTDKINIFLVVSVADCAPVYVYDKKRKVIALVHCGWKGAKDKIVEKTINVMVSRYDSNTDDLVVYIGPCASVCCYEVGNEFENFFEPRFLRFKNEGKFNFDLKSEILHQLISAGVHFKNVQISKHCTICEDNLFHSYRRDREKSGRMWALFGLKK